jgi:hypothetical protein
MLGLFFFAIVSEVQAAETCKDILTGLYDFRDVNSDDNVVSSLYNASCHKLLSKKLQGGDKSTNIGLNVFDKFDFNFANKDNTQSISDEVNELCLTKTLDGAKKEGV